VQCEVAIGHARIEGEKYDWRIHASDEGLGKQIRLKASLARRLGIKALNEIAILAQNVRRCLRYGDPRIHRLYPDWLTPEVSCGAARA
jgi:hypothetical protein